MASATKFHAALMTCLGTAKDVIVDNDYEVCSVGKRDSWYNTFEKGSSSVASRSWTTECKRTCSREWRLRDKKLSTTIGQAMFLSC